MQEKTGADLGPCDANRASGSSMQLSKEHVHRNSGREACVLVRTGKSVAGVGGEGSLRAAGGGGGEVGWAQAGERGSGTGLASGRGSMLAP
jgi:hypothetical protein